MSWRGFELHPDTPEGGIDLSRLHPNEEKSGMGDYIRKFAATFGIYDIIPSGRMPNTRRALAVAEFARDNGRLAEFRARAMDAHWKEGRDIGNMAVLGELAVAVGLDHAKSVLAATDMVYLKRVDEARVEYKRVGVGGIPAFVFGTEAIEGCQPYENLAAAAIRSGARRA